MKKKETFYFDDFDRTEKEDESVVEVEKIFTEDDIENAKAFGRAEGYSEGINEGFLQGEVQAIRERDLQLQATLNTMNEKLESILSANKAYIERAEKHTIELGMAIMKTVFPNLLREFMESETITFIQNIVRNILNVQKVSIHVNPDIHEILNTKLPEYFEENAEYIILHQNDNKDITECDIKWNGGWAYSNILENFDTLQNDIMQAYTIHEKLLIDIRNKGVTNV